MDKERLLDANMKESQDIEDHPIFERPQKLWIKGLPWILNALLSALLVALSLRKAQETTLCHQEVYSPAHKAVEYKTTVFTSSFPGTKTKYQGPPTTQVDDVWDELYNAPGISRIEKDSAMKLPNKTAPIPGDPGYYIAGLNVFHELHCLNNLRKLIWPEYYHYMEGDEPDKTLSRVDHLDHCVDFLRQSIMCHSDISTIYWVWDEKHQRNLAHADTTHTCRNFEKIRDWAVEHELIGNFDSRVHLVE